MKWILPFRFISLLSHLVLAILLLTNHEFNVRVCLPWNHSEDQYWSKDNELVIGLALSIVLLLAEIIAFISGISMLHSKQTFYSLCMHTFGSVSMLSFMLDGWECSLFWWIFALTIVCPTITETYVVLRILTSTSYGSSR